MSGQQMMILRAAKILCGIMSEMRDASVDSLPDVINSENIDLNLFRGAVQ